MYIPHLTILFMGHGRPWNDAWGSPTQRPLLSTPPMILATRKALEDRKRFANKANSWRNAPPRCCAKRKKHEKQASTWESPRWIKPTGVPQCEFVWWLIGLIKIPRAFIFCWWLYPKSTDANDANLSLSSSRISQILLHPCVCMDWNPCAHFDSQF